MHLEIREAWLHQSFPNLIKHQNYLEDSINLIIQTPLLGHLRGWGPEICILKDLWVILLRSQVWKSLNQVMSQVPADSKTINKPHFSFVSIAIGANQSVDPDTEFLSAAWRKQTWDGKTSKTSELIALSIFWAKRTTWECGFLFFIFQQ